MERLGPSLADLLKQCGGRFTLQTVTLIAIQLLHRIEFIHKHNILHRDIKPENCVIGGVGNESVVYLIDMGLSTRYSDPATVMILTHEFMMSNNNCFC